MTSHSHRPGAVVAAACLMVVTCLAAPARGDEIWVAPTSQADFGGLGIGSSTIWPATAAGVVRLAWAVPGDLQTFQSAKLVFIPHAFSPGGSGQLHVFVCRAQHSDLVGAACAGPIPHTFSSATNRLVEVDVSAAIGPQVGAPGLNYLAVLAYTTPTTATNHIVGLRFAYDPVASSGAATLGANTFTGTQTAPAFAGGGAGLINVNAAVLDGLDSTAFALTGHAHDVAQVSGAAKLAGGNLFTGTQTLDTGNLDLDASTAATGNLFKDGQLFLHNIGPQNTFLGEQAGNLTLTGGSNAVLGYNALMKNTTGTGNTAQGNHALFNNTTGSYNTASGYLVLFNNTIGTNNVAVGQNAGSNGMTGSNNIYLGANVFGSASDANAIYLGLQGLHTQTTIAGIRGTTVAGGEMVVVDANGRLGSGVVAPGANTVGSAQVIDGSLTAADLAFSVLGTGANTFTDTQTIATGNLALGDSTSTLSGNITKNGAVFLHNVGGSGISGGHNTFLGENAGNLAITGESNTAIGYRVLRDNTAGGRNTASGTSALTSNTEGSDNTATGASALFLNIEGSDNTGIGSHALFFSASGSGNVGVGSQAGFYSTGSHNIYLGANVDGGAGGESYSMYLGRQGTQTKTVIAGIRGMTTSVADAIPVLIDSTGRLGTVSSSGRFKEDIHDMADASRRLLQLRPVTFRYKQAYADGSKPIQHGLIAEEVADVFPELAVRSADGQVETVHYETLNVLLLNEFQKLSAQVQSMKEEMERLRVRLADEH